ncbi:hypothetical protein F5I97DRAFT_766219 [Phlebopus sp. FC_14]|nr:hypothetical protein F5I97DRAFT_766219 [Phlebopus sp. FC_14]
MQSTFHTPLPHPGTQYFLPSLMEHVRAALPGLPLEPPIVQGLLLCAIAGNKNSIIRTRDEDIGLVMKLTTLALSSVFGYNVHKFKCHSDAKDQTPSEFLRSLFFPPSTVTASTDGPLGTSHKHRDRHRRTSTSKGSGNKLPSGTPPSISMARSRKTSFSRSVSYTNESRPSITTLRQSHLDPVELAARDPEIIRNAELERPSLHADGAHTNPGADMPHTRMDVFRMPSAVVVSGLEHASPSAQEAVRQTFTEEKLVLSDRTRSECDQEILPLDLPANFIMIYVCRSDPRERPPIHKSLLDRFAISFTVNVTAQTRLAMRQYRPPPSPSSSLLSTHTSATTFPAMNFLPGPPTPPPPPPTSPAIPTGLLQQLRDLSATHTRIRAPLNLYLADLFTATRHFAPLDGMLLTVRARQDAEALIRASRVLGVDNTGAELIKEVANGRLRQTGVGSSSTERGYTRSHSSLASVSSDALLDGIDVPQIYEPSTASSGHHRSASDLMGEEEPLELDVSEADIARMFPRVVSHRLRVRDSPIDEVLSSVVCGAVSPPGEVQPFRPSEGEVWERDTVKDILVHILSEV